MTEEEQQNGSAQQVVLIRGCEAREDEMRRRDQIHSQSAMDEVDDEAGRLAREQHPGPLVKDYQENPFLIKPAFASAAHPAMAGMLPTVQSIVESMLPESIFMEIREARSEEEIQNYFHRLNHHLPLFKYEINQPFGTLILKVICQSEFTAGIGRYLIDVFSRWLVPGKRLNIVSALCFNFQFVSFPAQSFCFMEEMFLFAQQSDFSTALKFIPHLIEEVRINILAVYRVRYLASLKSISPEQRHQIVQQQLRSLFHPSDSTAHPTIYDQMHQFLLKLSEETKFGIVKDNLQYLIKNWPESVDRTIFYEISDFAAYSFTTLRNSKHVSRMVAFHYLFKKTLLQSIQQEPHVRHLSIKIIKVKLRGTDPVIGILIGMNLLRETERCESEHLLSAIQSCLPQVNAVTDSFIEDRREAKVRIFYLEVHKLHHLPFSIDEIRRLQKELPAILKRRVENVVHPIFMPRNEEEVLRNIVLLSKQIKFLRDLPHLTIHYEKQSDADISFLIVLVRLLKDKALPFKELVKTANVRILIDEVRSAGSLKQHWPKEAVVFRAIVDKAPFFRKDFSLDLKRARQKVVAELRHFLGEFRDYNGGMIHKQDEALENLRKIIGSSVAHHEVLLENFFHSLRPGIMQTIHAPEHLRLLFKLLLEVLAEDIVQKVFSLKVSGESKYFFIMIGAVAPLFREEVQAAIAQFKIASYDLTSTFLHVQDFATLGYILRIEDVEKRAQLQQALLDAMLKWKNNFSCKI